jgi:hypothetical protein
MNALTQERTDDSIPAERMHKKQKAVSGNFLPETAFWIFIPATTYSPTQLPAQYHQLKRA